MPLYLYKVLTADDKLLEGEIDAASEKIVIAKLQEMGYFPVSTKLLGEEDKQQKFWQLSKDISSLEVLQFTQKLAVTMKAGLTLDSALALLIETANTERLKLLLEKVTGAIHNGQSLSDALQQYSTSFDRFYLNTLRAGESAGGLELVLARLAAHLERSRATQKSVQAALIYPVVLVVVALITLFILLVYVVPQFQSLFEDMGKALPLPTQIVIAIADAFQHYAWIGGLLIVAGVMLVKKMLKDSQKRQPIDRFLLALPIISSIAVRLEVTRFSRGLATLLSNGVPMLSALAVVGDSVNNSVIRQAITKATSNVKEGRSIASTLKTQKVFPPLAVQLIQVGEETGELVDMLEQVADIYDTELQESVQRFLILLEPLLIITLGIVIAGIIISVLLAILALNDFAA